MNVNVWYDEVSIFMNNMEWWLRYSIFRKGDTCVEIVRMWIVWGFDLRRCPDSSSKLDSHEWRLPWDESRKRFIQLCLRFKIWADLNRTYGLTLCIWELYSRFEIRTDQNILYSRFEIGTDRNRWIIYDSCKPLSLTQCTSLSEVESLVSLYVSQYMYDMSYCKNMIMTMCVWDEL